MDWKKKEFERNARRRGIFSKVYGDDVPAEKVETYETETGVEKWIVQTHRRTVTLMLEFPKWSDWPILYEMKEREHLTIVQD